ncbi:MAG: transposase [Leptospirales bacterium]
MGVSIAEDAPLERDRPVVPGCLCRCRIRPRDFLQQFQTELPEPIAVVWDNLTDLRAKIVQGHIRSSERQEDTFLPPYPPELNPVEYIWSYLKKNPLANRAPDDDLEELHRLTVNHVRELKGRSDLLRSLMQHSPLFY